MLVLENALRTMRVEVERFEYHHPFEISGYVFDHSRVVTVTLSQGSHIGTGEASGVYYLGDDTDNIVAQIESVRDAVEAGVSRAELQSLLPRSGARNAIDCAMWALEAAQAQKSVAELAGVPRYGSLETTFTLGVADPEDMANAALKLKSATALKLKLGGEPRLDFARVAAVRSVRPDIWLAVDANQGFNRCDMDALITNLVTYDVSLLEQPLRRGCEEDLRGFGSPIPIAADESVLETDDLVDLVGLFDIINIKLDKCGGLTEALRMARRAKELGFGVMVGNMMGTSRAMAPAFVLGQYCSVVDLDGPTFLARDTEPAVKYDRGRISLQDPVWAPTLFS